MIRNQIYENTVLVLLSALIICYTFYKSINSSFTCDESLTYNLYVNIWVSDIINYSIHPGVANNHILNTLLMKASQSLFGSSEFALRLPNLLAHITYVIFTIVLLKKFDNAILTISGFIILNYNTYLLDFFSIARGYGLSISFMLISFYFLTTFFLSFKKKHSWLAFLSGAFSVLSNFTLLNYYVALFGVFFVFVFQRSLAEEKTVRQKIKFFLIQSLPALIISFFLYRLIAKPLQSIQGYLIGRYDTFYSDTIRSLVLSTTNYVYYDFVTRFSVFIYAVIIFSAIFYLYDLFKNRLNFSRSHFILVLLILCLSGFSTSLQHYLFNTPYLENRTALFFIVLFNICFVYFYRYSILNFKPKKLIHTLFSTYSIFCIIFFFYTFNTKYYRDWQYDCNTKDMIISLMADHQNTNPNRRNIKLGTYMLCEPATNYYRVTKHLDWLNPVDGYGYDGDFDYYYLHDDLPYITRNKKTIIKEFPVSNAVLAKSN